MIDWLRQASCWPPPRSTVAFVADLADAAGAASSSFDCIICTETLTARAVT